MISSSSALASSQPATSSKVTSGVSPLSSFAFDLPNWKARELPPCICRQMKIQMTMISTQGRDRPSQMSHSLPAGSPFTSTPSAWSWSTNSRLASKGSLVWNRRSSRPSRVTAEERVPSISRPSRITTDSTLSAASWERKAV